MCRPMNLTIFSDDECDENDDNNIDIDDEQITELHHNELIHMDEVSLESNGCIPDAPILNLDETNNIQCNNYGSTEDVNSLLYTLICQVDGTNNIQGDIDYVSIQNNYVLHASTCAVDQTNDIQSKNNDLCELHYEHIDNKIYPNDQCNDSKLCVVSNSDTFQYSTGNEYENRSREELLDLLKKYETHAAIIKKKLNVQEKC